MKLYDRAKFLCTCKIKGRMQEYRDYIQCLETKQKEIKMYTRFLNDAIDRFSATEKMYEEGSKEYINAKNDINKWKYTLNEAKLALKFIRPNMPEDIEYRDHQYDNFVTNLEEVISPDFDLRFHGTSIYFAQQIIKEGKISSSADRYDGYIKSDNRRGEISVSNIKTLATTIHGWFSDLSAYRRSLPCGCVFAILPKDREDAAYGPNLIKTVDFKENPEQLFGIITTPENIKRIYQWMKKEKLNSDSVYTFEDFLQAVKEKSNDIDEKNSFRKRIEQNNTNTAISRDSRNYQEQERQSEKEIKND